MNQDVLYFFDGKPDALFLYEAFEEKVFSEVDGVKVKVQKTQISLSLLERSVPRACAGGEDRPASDSQHCGRGSGKAARDRVGEKHTG